MASPVVAGAAAILKAQYPSYATDQIKALIKATADDISDHNSPPMLSQVAWSKAIEYDADMAMAVHRHPADLGRAGLRTERRRWLR